MRATTPARHHLLAGVLAAVLIAATAPAVTTRLYASDEVMYYVYLRSLWFDHDLSFDNEYRHMYESGIARTDGFRQTLLERTTATGRRVNFGGIGCAIFWAPFYAVGDAWAHAARWVGSSVAPDGYSRPYIAAACYASAIYGWLALLLSALAASKVVGPGATRLRAIAPPLLVFLGTPLAFYMYVAPPFAHATSAFAVSAFTLAWLVVRRRWSVAGSLGLGVLTALLVMVREQDAFVVLGPAIDFTWTWVDGRLPRAALPVTPAPPSARRQLFLRACAGIAGFALAFLPQALAYWTLYGRIGPSPLLTRKMAWTSPHAIGVVFSPEHGLLAWTPLLAFAIAGLVLLVVDPQSAARGTLGEASASDTRRIGICLLAMLAGHVYVTGCVASWTVAGAFGQRRFIALTPLFVIGLAAVVSRLRARAARTGLAIACLLCVWWNVGLMIQFGAGLMDRQRLDLRECTRMTFMVLPRRIPGLAYRYVFDRASFYRSPGTRD